jgi:hypothetical protein
MQETFETSDNPNQAQNEAEAIPNIVARIIPLLNEIVRQMGYQGSPLFPVIESPPLPPWVTCVCGKLANTIFKSSGSLKVGKELDFYLIGKLIGLLLRMAYAVLVEMPREIDGLKLGDLPKEKQDRVKEALDLTPVRSDLLKAAKAIPDTTKSNEELLGDAAGLMAGDLAEKVMTLVYAALKQPPDLTIQFLRGLPDGYTMFLLENGEFSGDRGRTRDYFALLAFWPEIEAMRSGDGITRAQLYPKLREMDETILENEPDRFETICEEIGLALKKPGAPKKE